MDDRMLAYCISLQEQLLEVWAKLGGILADWDETHIHNILFQKAITDAPKYEWEQYTQAEKQVAIAILKRILSGYTRKWDTQQAAERAGWEKTKELRASYMNRMQAHEWLHAHAPGRLLPEFFEYVDSAAGNDYFRLRETPITFYTPHRAREFFKARCLDEASEFPAPFFEAVTLPGHNGLLFRPLFTLGIQHERA